LKPIVLSDYQFATTFGALGLVLGLIIHLIHFHWLSMTVPGYELWTAPGKMLLRFFSEETPYRPKLIIFLIGQFIGYFFVFYVYRKLKR
jgi:hypothetical protein